jgi:FkbM family methyltransferase
MHVLVFGAAALAPVVPPGYRAIQRSEQAAVPLRWHPLRELFPAAAKHTTHEPHAVWADLLAAAGIGPHHGLFIDVGAACRMEDGRVALSLGYRVLAFELRQKCQKMLRDAFAAPLANRSLELRGTAVSNISAHRLMYEAHDSSSLEALAVATGVEKTFHEGSRRHTYRVQTTTLDEVVGQHAVAVIKLDIQGHEHEALLGAHALLSRPAAKAPLVEFEYYEYLRPNMPRHSSLHLLRGYGYECYDIGAGRRTRTLEQPIHSDFACIKRRKQAVATRP